MWGEVFHQKQDVGLKGENVLKYIQGCFETCAKDFIICSPTVSCSSSSSFGKDQDEGPFQREEQEQPAPQIHVQNAFNTIICLPSSNQKDLCPGENVSEDEEGLNTSHVLDDDDDFDISLGSPALLLEEEKCEEKPSTSQCEGMLNSGEDKFVFAVNVEQDKDVAQYEMCHERKETKELSAVEPKSSAAPSHQNKMSESLASSEDMRTYFTQRNTANVEPEDDCEFLIEESFGISSKSWISASQKKKQKPQKKSLISAPSRQKREVSQHSARKKDKRTSEKLVTPTAIKQTKMTNVAETTVDKKNISGSNKIMSLVDDQPLLVLNTTQKGKQKIDSKGKVSEEISTNISTSINQTEDHAALLEEDNSFLEEPQAVLRTAERSPNSMRTVKHKHPKTKTSAEKQNEGSQERASVITASENSQPFKNTDMCSENSVSVLKPILPVEPAEQKSSNKKSQPAKQKSSNKKSQPAKQKSSNKKALKRQKPVRTTQSKKQLETQKSSLKEPIIRASRRKERILVSKSSESELEDEQCNEGVDKHCPYELRRITNSRKPSQKTRQTSLVSSEDSDCESMSCEEDSSEQYLTEKRLYSSAEQQKSATSSLQSSSPSDVNMINASGPLDNKAHSKRKETFDRDISNTDESEDFMRNLGGLVSNSLKHKLVLPTNTPNVRRTKRMRIKPLEYWRGERVEYKTRPSGGFVFGGIISPEQKEPRKSKPKKTVNPVVELGFADTSVPDTSVSSLKDPDQPAVVFDVASNQEILLECVKSGSSHVFFVCNEAVSIYKYLNTPSFSVGKMVLKPLKEKGQQYSHTDTLVFHISQGKLLLNLYDQCYCLTAGDYFFIPPGNVYNIRNLLNQECIICFTQLKGMRSES
ncbi:centromere protein C [Sceloporus undulatus]|uniref:centromere protein C n=1 Tax=Sceloporus undulatus TaxID=8520 RepID=UPI001C4BF725|nr:centromere protein C [Sceloporus undulatus]